MLKIIRSEKSKRDTSDIWHYIAIDNPASADRLLHQINDALQLIASFPGIGQMRDELIVGARSYPVGNYLVFYKCRIDAIEIIRVVHGSRDLERMFESELPPS